MFFNHFGGMKMNLLKWVIRFLVGTVRVIALLLLPPVLLGFLMYSGSFNGLWLAYFITSIIALGAIPLLPRAWFKYRAIRFSVVVLGAVVIILAIPIMKGDLGLVNGADMPAFTLRFIQCVVLAVMSMEAVFYPLIQRVADK